MSAWRIPAIIVIAGVATGVPAAEPQLDDLLAKAAHYVRGFAHDFARLISDESCVQWESVARAVRGQTRTSESKRTIDSETLFQWVTSENAWITVRTVVRVDGRAVPDSRARLENLLTGAARSDAALFRRLRDESARYNIGRIRRNVSDPMLLLQIADSQVQPRFEFALEGQETLEGLSTWRVGFAERSTPSIIAVDDQSIPSRGTMWLASSGIIVQTQLDLGNPATNLSASITVAFAPNRRAGGWVPARMIEHYSEAPRDAYSEDAISDQIIARTTYSNYRRFETSGRIVDPK